MCTRLLRPRRRRADCVANLWSFLLFEKKKPPYHQSINHRMDFYFVCVLANHKEKSREERGEVLVLVKERKKE